MCMKTSCQFISRLNLATTQYFSNFIKQQVILNHKKRKKMKKRRHVYKPQILPAD